MPSPIATATASVGGLQAISSAPPPALPPAPSPDEPIPRQPAALAEALSAVTAALDDSIDSWTKEGDPSRGQAPSTLILQALYQQRLYRRLVADPSLASKTLRRLSGGLASDAAAITAAGRELSSLVGPITGAVPFRTGPPAAAGRLLGWFEEAQARFGVRWQLLAAVNFVESRFGRVRANSSAGAQGPMQFLSATWARYGLGGDVHDPRDAILGAANYLHASGSPGNDRAALSAYNHSQAYVDAILAYAGRMERDTRAYYAFYNWQVFVRTTGGDVRLTGPGL